MIDESTLRKLRDGNQDTIDAIAQKLERKTLTYGDIVRIWEATVEGAQSGPNVSALVNFGVDRLSNASQDPEVGKMYENLLSLQGFPAVKIAFIPTISIGAALARLSQGEVPEKLNKETYIRLAKACLLNAIAKGNDDTRKYAAEALRYIEDMDVKAELISLARTSSIGAVKEAAGESVGFMRAKGERSDARDDGEILLRGYMDETSPQRMYLECVFTAVDTVFGKRAATPAEKLELEVAVKQLASFGAEPGDMAGLFSKAALELIQTNVENALLHALTNGHSKAVKMEAAAGLEKIASDRLEVILERIVARLGEGNETGAIASDALAGIRGKKLEIFEITIPAPAAVKQRPQAQPLKRGMAQ